MLNQCLVSDYKQGLSIADLNKKYSIPLSSIRNVLKKEECLRTPKEAHSLAGKQGRMSRLQERIPHSSNTKEKMRQSRLKWADSNAKGKTLKTTGYIEYTRGEHKGKSVHVVLMEERIGRNLKPDECVHHIDGNKSNNGENNLALLTKSAHARLHRFEDALSGNLRERDENGRYC